LCAVLLTEVNVNVDICQVFESLAVGGHDGSPVLIELKIQEKPIERSWLESIHRGYISHPQTIGSNLG
jgi:hypothetical protein